MQIFKLLFFPHAFFLRKLTVGLGFGWQHSVGRMKMPELTVNCCGKAVRSMSASSEIIQNKCGRIRNFSSWQPLVIPELRY